MADWKTIKTEYITTDTSYRKLAAKYGISANQINRVGKEEKWAELRKQFVDKTVADSVRKISKNRSDRAARIDRATDELDLKITTRKVKVERGTTEITTVFREAEEGGIVDRAGLRQLTAALKDLKEIKGILSDMDKQEKQARIDNLRRQADQADNGGNEPLTVQLEGVEEYAL